MIDIVSALHNIPKTRRNHHSTPSSQIHNHTNNNQNIIRSWNAVGFAIIANAKKIPHKTA